MEYEKKDIVTIVCYGHKKQMERDEAIRFYREGFFCSEGSEQNRYANILIGLYGGDIVCTDGDDDIII